MVHIEFVYTPHARPVCTMQRLPEEVTSQMSETEKRNAQIMASLKETARSSEPMWSKKNNTTSNSKRT